MCVCVEGGTVCVCGGGEHYHTHYQVSMALYGPSTTSMEPVLPIKTLAYNNPPPGPSITYQDPLLLITV